MLKIFLFLVFSTFAFAVDSGTEWWIYSYEDIGTLKSVFNYLAMVNQDSGYAQTMKFAIFAGMSFTVFLKFFDLTAIPKYFVSSVAIMMLVFGTTATVHIVNVKSYDSVNPQIDNYATVDNVPYIFSILTSCFSNIGYSSAVLIETIFSSITDNEQIMETSFLKTGHMGTFKLLVKLDSVDPFNLDNNGKNLKKVLENYMQVCIYDIALSTDGNIKNELTLQSDYMAYLSPTNSSNDAIKRIGTISVKKYDGSSTSCSALFNEANGYYTTLKNDVKIYNAAKALALKDTSNFDNAASSVVGMMNQSNLTNTQAKITTYIMNNGLMGAIENSWQNYGVGTSNGVNSSSQAGFGSGLAIGQLQLSGKVKAKAASMMLPAMHSVLQAVMYVLFPIILVVQLFAGGIKIIQNYVMGLLWLEFWIPSYSVLNYFTTKEAQTEAVNMLIKTTNEATSASGLLNLSNANEIYNTIANEAAIAADMYWMIPALAGFILFASFHSISGITGAVAGVVGQYSSSRTLESERNEFAALDAVNKEMKNQNPMYTGDIGELKQMQGQMQFQSAASVAAGKFLASGGSSVNDISSMAKTDMFGGYETQKTSQTRMNSLTNGGSISGASSSIENNAKLESSKFEGNSTAVKSNANLLTMVENSTNVSTQENAFNGNAKKDALEEKFGSLEKGLDSSSHVNEFTKVDSLKKQIDVANGEDNLIDLNSTVASSQTSSSKGEKNEAERHNMSLQDWKEKTATNKTSDEIAKFNAKKQFGSINDKGSNTELGDNIINADTKTSLSQTKFKLDNANGSPDAVAYVEGKQAGGNFVKNKTTQQELDSKEGGFFGQMSDSGTFDALTISGKNTAMRNVGKDKIEQDSEVKATTSAGSSEAEKNALNSMIKAGLLPEGTSLFAKKVVDGGNFTAVDEHGNKTTMFTDGKGNIIGYEQNSIKDTKDGGAAVRTIFNKDGKVLATHEDGATKKDYSNTGDHRIGDDYSIENKGAPYKLMNDILRLKMNDADTEEKKGALVQKYLDSMLLVDQATSPLELSKAIAKFESTGYREDIDTRFKPTEDWLLNKSDSKQFTMDDIKDLQKRSRDAQDEFLINNIPGGESFVNARNKVDKYFSGDDEKTSANPVPKSPQINNKDVDEKK